MNRDEALLENAKVGYWPLSDGRLACRSQRRNLPPAFSPEQRAHRAIHRLAGSERFELHGTPGVALEELSQAVQPAPALATGYGGPIEERILFRSFIALPDALPRACAS